MAKLSQKQLEAIAAQRVAEKNETEIFEETKELSVKENELSFSPKMIADILNSDKLQSPYKYQLPDTMVVWRGSESIPFVQVEEFPKINIQGKISANRQVKGANLYLLKEIDWILSNINEGKNKNATINFLIWVGLQSLKGVSKNINIHVHDSTYADGVVVDKYFTKNETE